jgi:glutamate N-acetyltransferase/amino-acid N-acetyltransferase
VIGVPLPYEKITRTLADWSRRDDGAELAARAIMTTDTRPKMAHGQFTDGGRRYRVAGMCKGAGMIHPRMATMLGFIFTDAPALPATLARLLRRSVEQSFNRITIDGDTSTNDTVALFSSGQGRLSDAGRKAFAKALDEVTRSLAQQIVLDGEGAKRFVTIRVTGAKSPTDAERAVRAIAHSPLVKTALAGADANWGRVLAAAGYSGARFDAERAEIRFNELLVYRRGVAVPFDEADAHQQLDQKQVTVTIDLGAGKAESWMWTCDLTEEYIRINAHYRT